MTVIAPGARALITGGAGGIGLALATQLRQRGADILLVDLKEEPLRAASSALQSLSGSGKIATITADVRRVEDLERARDHAIATMGGVDLVFNNAGVTHYGTFEAAGLEVTRRLIEINLMGVIHGCHVFLPLMREQGGGHIINMASSAAITGIPRQSAYCASKAGVRAFSESLSAELAGSNIGVTWMVAGAIATDIISNAGSEDTATTGRLSDLLKKGGMRPEKVAKRLLQAVEKNQGEVVLTIDGNLTNVMNRISPQAMRASMRFVNRMALRREAQRK